MFELRIPTRVKFFPNFLKEFGVRRKLLFNNQPSPNITFHLCYFSCESYFKYLYCAIHSLSRLNLKFNLKIYIFSDEEQQISESNFSLITELVPNCQILVWPKSMGWGATQISNIWNAYKYVADNAASNDVIARIDSDVFFFNDRIFEMVAKSDADLVGDGHFVEFKYAQGGCYFFKRKAVLAITAMIDEFSIDALLTDCPIDIVEDVAATHFTKIANLKVWLTWFMVFPQEIKNAKGIGKWINFKFSCAHFVMKNKDKMLEAYLNDILNEGEKNSFLQQLTLSK